MFNKDYYIKIRREIHAHPELKYCEDKTSQLVANHLKNLGYEVKENIAKTGVIGLLDTKKEGPTIAFRADMDALPLTELNDFEYRSKIDGKMHACGHDGHTASLLCAAEALMNNKDNYKGKIKLIFQPAEEGGAGAKVMIDEGVLENPHVDAIFGFHNRPGFKQGMLFVKSGPAMGGNATLIIDILGKGGHAAMPHLAKDPVVVVAEIIMSIQTIVSRRLSPLQSGVITVCKVEAGTADNVIAETARLTLSVRSDTLETKDLLLDEIEKVVKNTSTNYGCDFKIDCILNIPPLHNDPACSEIAIDAFKKNNASDSIEMINYMPTMGAEDFAFYLLERPGCYFFIGNGEDSAYLHNPHYDFNDENIEVAVKAYLSLANHYLT